MDIEMDFCDIFRSVEIQFYRSRWLPILLALSQKCRHILFTLTNETKKFDCRLNSLICRKDNLSFTSRQKHTDCVQMLNSELLPFDSELRRQELMFQQDGDFIHLINMVKTVSLQIICRFYQSQLTALILTSWKISRQCFFADCMLVVNSLNSLLSFKNHWVTPGIIFANQKFKLCVVLC